MFFAVVDPLGHPVQLTNACYRYHILVRHPELVDVVQLQQTIIQPDRIVHDAIDTRRRVYYRQYQREPERWYRLIVEEMDNGVDEVLTAHRTRRFKEGEEILWQPL